MSIAIALGCATATAHDAAAQSELSRLTRVLETGPPQTTPPREIRVQQVSHKVAVRLAIAEQALRFVKAGIPHAGNQRQAIDATQGNSYVRSSAKRAVFDLAFEKDGVPYLIPNQKVPSYLPTAALRKLAAENPLATEAATIALTKGGQCMEHADLAFHFLTGRRHGQPVHLVSVKGVDHRFVIIGDLKRDADHELVVVDPWVLKPQALLWSHFAYHEKDRSQIVHMTMPAPKRGKTRQSAIRRQLRLALQESLKPHPPVFEATYPAAEVPNAYDIPHASKVDWRYEIPQTAREQARASLARKPGVRGLVAGAIGGLRSYWSGRRSASAARPPGPRPGIARGPGPGIARALRTGWQALRRLGRRDSRSPAR